jgi:ferredoxin
METGPRTRPGFDLALTELVGPEGHNFIIRAESKRALDLISKLNTTAATSDDLEREDAALESAARHQVRKINLEKIEEFLYSNFDNARWETIAKRCLTCANCTLVCPTCFCTTVEDASSLDGCHAERWRRWDSCFTLGFSYIHGGNVRASAKSRYRQWVTHKLASWIGQFGTSGCVGCGRCITWCPAGIDLTEEVRVLREGDHDGNP